MLNIFHHLLIPLLLTCRRLGLLGCRVVQEFGSNGDTFTRSMFRRFHIVRSSCYHAAILMRYGPLKYGTLKFWTSGRWHQVGNNALSACPSQPQQHRLPRRMSLRVWKNVGQARTFSFSARPLSCWSLRQAHESIARLVTQRGELHLQLFAGEADLRLALRL